MLKEHNALCPSAEGGFLVHFVENLCALCGKKLINVNGLIIRRV